MAKRGDGENDYTDADANRTTVTCGCGLTVTLVKGVKAEHSLPNSQQRCSESGT